MTKNIFKYILTALAFSVVIVLAGTPALAARPASQATTLLGNDISWPQCGKKLPTGQAFAVVGVNDGLANTTNPCLASELTWARKSSGGTGQPFVALYVNTANPGQAGIWWPGSNDYGGTTVNNPYGTCAGAVDTACAYMYGYAKAYDDVNIRGVSTPASYLWWLDVETVNSWQTDKATNAADLEGMVTYFQSIGAQVGLYSTNYQWGQIVGSVSSSSKLNNLRSWLAGASGQTAAKTMCTNASPLTAGSPVVLTQFIQKNLDYDYSCI